jgi:hypothetical protein
MPTIHVFFCRHQDDDAKKVVDGRDERDHDG